MTDLKDKQKLLRLLKRKLELINNMLEITEYFQDISPEADSADSFISMQEKRTNIVDEMKILDQEFKLPVYKSLWDGEDRNVLEQIKSLQHLINETATKILKANEKIDENSKKIMDDLRKELKTVNREKNINNYYQRDPYEIEGMSSFNVSN